MLERDRKCSVRERIIGRERGEGQGGRNGIFELACIAQRSHEPMVRFEVFRIRIDRLTKSGDRFARTPGSEQIHATLVECS